MPAWVAPKPRVVRAGANLGWAVRWGNVGRWYFHRTWQAAIDHALSGTSPAGET